jgi:hypothetical protein
MHTFEIKTQPRLCPMPCGDGTAVVELPSRSSLADLAEMILKAMEFDDDHAYGFFDNLKNVYRSKEKYTLFADQGDAVDDSEKGVSTVSVGTAFHKAGKKPMFLFDYGDDWHFLVTCSEIKEDKGSRKRPRVVSVSGERPVQYPGFDEE